MVSPVVTALRARIEAASSPSRQGNWNDDLLAQEFIQHHSGNLRFIEEELQWLHFSEERGWQRVSEPVITDLVAQYSRGLIREESIRSLIPSTSGEPSRVRQMATLGNRNRITAAVALAAADPRVRISVDDIDQDPNLVGALNGVVNLSDGTFEPFTRDQLITRRIACSYDPAAECPNFMVFLAEVQQSSDVRAYLQRLWGYSLTGYCGEHVIAFNFGGGANGKSTALDQMLLSLGGDYGAKLSDALVYRRLSGAPNPEIELARLSGVRFALGEENSESGSLNESVLKDLTGGDTIVARHPYGRHFEYRSKLKVHLHGNHRPRIQGTDDGIWRRFHLIEWGVQIPRERQDSGLPARLRQEFPGILNWIIQGSMDQIAQGLRPPQSIQVATAEFRSESDTFGDFINSMTIVDGPSTYPPSSISKRDLFDLYNSYCEDQRIMPLHRHNLRRFNQRIASRGFRSHRGTAGREFWLGLRQAPVETEVLGFN